MDLSIASILALVTEHDSCLMDHIPLGGLELEHMIVLAHKIDVELSVTTGVSNIYLCGGIAINLTTCM